MDRAVSSHSGLGSAVLRPHAGQAVSYRSRVVSNATVLAAGDALSLGMALFAAAVVEHWASGGALAMPPMAPYLGVLWFCGAGLLRLLPGWGLGPVEELRRVTTLLFAVFGTLIGVTLYSSARLGAEPIAAAEVLHHAAALLAAAIASTVLVPLVRTRARRALNQAGQWGIPAVVFGTESARDAIADCLEAEVGMGYTPVTRGDLSALGAARAQAPQSVAVVALEGLDRDYVTRLLEGPLLDYRTVIVVPDLAMSPCLWVQPRDLHGVLGLEITSNLSSVTSRVTKRASDVLLVALAAPVWVPVCLAIAALIWLEDRCDPLFRQERVGLGGDAFDTLKFRTMRPDAEAVLERELAADPALRAEWEACYKLRDDPRITRVGRLLRGLSLDELPQLLNVLRGDMSLVGPRPLPAYHHTDLSEAVQTQRERVRPGITGLWQVSGRSDIGNEGMELWDPYYVRNWSLWLDIVILVRTARAVTARSGAY